MKGITYKYLSNKVTPHKYLSTIGITNAYLSIKDTTYTFLVSKISPTNRIMCLTCIYLRNKDIIYTLHSIMGNIQTYHRSTGITYTYQTIINITATQQTIIGFTYIYHQTYLREGSELKKCPKMWKKSKRGKGYQCRK